MSPESAPIQRVARPAAGSRPRRMSRLFRLLAIAVTLGTAAAVVAPASSASAAGCGFLGLGACPPAPPTGAPGTPVPQLPQLNQSTNGGTNPIVGDVPSTARMGTPNAGVVPIIGPRTDRADDGAFVAYESVLNSRTVDLMVYSPALKGAAPVRLLLPPSWAAQPGRSYPSVYLINGGNDKADYQSWSIYSRVPQETAGIDALFVMPSAGSDAFVTNYYNGGDPTLGNQYDTFFSVEVPQLLQRGYRADGRSVVAGLSSGGYSALALAALHPGEYAAAASFSGLDNPSVFPIAQIIQLGQLVEFHSPFAMWGSWLLQNSIWKAHDPTVLAAQLRGTNVFVSSGNGQVGPLDPAGAGTDPIEPVVQGASLSFVAAAVAADVTVVPDFYGPGTHSWPYWDRELVRAWPLLAASLGGGLGGV